MVVARSKAWHRADLGQGDNNDAEWLALLHALEVARSLGADDVTLLGDAAMVVQQASGTAPCRAERFRLRLAEFRALAGGFRRVRVRRIGRAQNLAGIALEQVHERIRQSLLQGQPWRA